MHSTNQLLMDWRARPACFGLLVALLTIVLGCKGDSETIRTNPSVARTISSVIAEKDQFTLLEAAITRAGLSTSLTQGGPFTLLAPTDDAFRAAGFTDVAAINALPAATLNDILLYHVVSRRDLSPSTFAATVQQTAYPTLFLGNAPLFVTKVSSTSVSVNGARIFDGGTYSLADNGSIYAVDQVLSPPAENVLQVVQADTSLSLFATAIRRGGVAITGALSNPTTVLTVFAPTNAAFRAAGFSNAAAINAIPEATLIALLTNHVVPNVRAFSPVITNGPVTTFGGGVVTAAVGANNSVMLLSRGNGTRASNVLYNGIILSTVLVRNRDITATNGVIHKIDRVLLP